MFDASWLPNLRYPCIRRFEDKSPERSATRETCLGCRFGASLCDPRSGLDVDACAWRDTQQAPAARTPPARDSRRAPVGDAVFDPMAARIPGTWATSISGPIAAGGRTARRPSAIQNLRCDCRNCCPRSCPRWDAISGIARHSYRKRLVNRWCCCCHTHCR